MKRIAFSMIFIPLTCGCFSPYRHKPASPTTSIAPIAVRIAVLPFKDATGDWQKQGLGFASSTGKINLAKKNWSNVPLVSGQILAESFVTELANSGGFAGARLAFDSKPADGEVLISGTVREGTFETTGAFTGTYYFDIEFVAVNAQGKTVWKSEIRKVVPRGGTMMTDTKPALEINAVLNNLFGQALLTSTMGHPGGYLRVIL